ncbi:MAG: rsbT 1 [Planctomycetaceae bacterium]|nr:rsbT 1 [Planctomycetaceae bacterium]
MPTQIVIPVADISQVGEARRIVARLSSDAQYSETLKGRLAIITTELATNLVRHAGQGKLLAQVIETASGSAFELISLDQGRGIAHLDKALMDGYSTGGTAGQGLGAIRRQSDEFDIYSQVDHGTIVLSRVSREPVASTPNSLVWGAVSIPAPHETECGDCWRLATGDGWFSLMIADGLGHGPLAAEAADKAAEAFLETRQAAPSAIVQAAHSALCGTRGAALAVARCDTHQSKLKYAGVGNISGTLVSGADRRGLTSHNGIVGVQFHKVQEFEYSYGDRAILVMHSDGLQGRWTFEKYPGLMQRHPAIIAGVLYRDFQRGRDDATVVVVRWSSLKV